MDCRICGRQFDPLGFQVMVPGLPLGFDRVDCALEASALDPPSPRAVEPVPAAVRALPTTVAIVPALAGGPGLAPMARAESVRPQLFAGANLALLAAGTVLTIYLWLRVFGADAGPFAFPAANASEAFGRTAVAAAIDLTPEQQIRPEPENTIRGAATPAPSAATGVRRTTGPWSPIPRPRRSRALGGREARRSDRRRPPAPPSEPAPPRSAPVPTFPVPALPPDDRVPGPALPERPHPRAARAARRRPTLARDTRAGAGRVDNR